MPFFSPPTRVAGQLGSRRQGETVARKEEQRGTAPDEITPRGRFIGFSVFLVLMVVTTASLVGDVPAGDRGSAWSRWGLTLLVALLGMAILKRFSGNAPADMTARWVGRVGLAGYAVAVTAMGGGPSIVVIVLGAAAGVIIAMILFECRSTREDKEA